MLADNVAAAVDKGFGNLSLYCRIVPAVCIHNVHSNVGVNSLSAKIESCVSAYNLCEGESCYIAELVGFCF